MHLFQALTHFAEVEVVAKYHSEDFDVLPETTQVKSDFIAAKRLKLEVMALRLLARGAKNKQKGLQKSIGEFVDATGQDPATLVFLPLWKAVSVAVKAEA